MDELPVSTLFLAGEIGFRASCLPESLLRGRVLAIRRQHLQKNVQVATQHDVRRYAVAQGRTGALYQELVQRLEGHPALRARPLIHRSKYFPFSDERSKSRKQIGCDNGNTAESPGIVKGFDHGNGIGCADVYGSEVRVSSDELARQFAGLPRIIMRLQHAGNFNPAIRLLQKRPESVHFFGVMVDGQIAGHDQNRRRAPAEGGQ